VACDSYRNALSARLDGEPFGLPEAELDAHVAGCRPCRDWLEAAAEVTRRARLVPATAVPDVTAAVLGRLPARPGTRRLVRWADRVLRGALLGVGVGQLVVGLPALVGEHPPATDPMSAPVHLAHETAAWNVGLAACFLVVAALPRLAAGALPFLLSFTAVLSWVTVGDLGAGHVHAGRAVAHGFLLLGALLVTALAVRGRTARPGPADARSPGGPASWRATLRARLKVQPAPLRPDLRLLGSAVAPRSGAPAERPAA
jgi:predicted anti-sigma-YlaC factor YlaD